MPCCLDQNGDIKRKEVRLELGYFFDEKKNQLKEDLKSKEIKIVAETKERERDREGKRNENNPPSRDIKAIL